MKNGKKLTACKACGNEIAKSAKSCPHCGAKNKKPIFKKWWFWVIVVAVFVSAVSGEDEGTEKTTASEESIVRVEEVFEETVEETEEEIFEVVVEEEVAEELVTEEPVQEIVVEEETAVEEELSLGKINALGSAKNYLRIMAFSYEGLVKQLEFEGYTNEEAVYAAEHCDADWNEQAAKSAKNYLDLMSFSRQGLIDQLVFEGFTQAQAEYGVAANGY